MSIQNTQRMLVIELNEAEKYFLDKFIQAGFLPVFKKLKENGLFLKTEVFTPEEKLLFTKTNFIQEKQEEQQKENTYGEEMTKINPGMVWPSVYSGLPLSEHNIIGYGQKTDVLVGNCIWDNLNAQGISTGLLGSLAYPVRRNPYSLFYIPEPAYENDDCTPKYYKSIQNLLLFIANQQDEFFLLSFLKTLWKVLLGAIKGIPLKTANQILKQIYQEKYKGVENIRNRALLQAQCQMDLFQLLLARYKPAFATLHLNHIAYMQHRYWRAAEPETYQDKVGELDSYFFGDVETRKDYELTFKDAILDSFILTEHFLEKLIPLLDPNTLLVIITGLGQKKMDPLDEIHQPEIRFFNIKRLLDLADISNCEILTQMDPSITLNFPNAMEASLAAYKLSNLKVLGEYPLFQVKQLEKQLFLEGHLPPEVWFLDSHAWIEDNINEHILPLYDFVRLSRVKNQSTATHQEQGWILFYGNLAGFSKPLQETLREKANKEESLNVTEIAPLLLSYFEGNNKKQKVK